MISFPRRERAQTAAAVVGIDAGKFSHTLVIRPRGQPDSKPFSFSTTRAGFEAAVAILRQQAPGAELTLVLGSSDAACVTRQALFDNRGNPMHRTLGPGVNA